MKFETRVQLICIIIVTMIVLSIGKLAWDTRIIAESTRLATDQDVVKQVEYNYRECLRRKAGMVGVASLKQMNMCAKETGYTS